MINYFDPFATREENMKEWINPRRTYNPHKHNQRSLEEKRAEKDKLTNPANPYGWNTHSGE